MSTRTTPPDGSVQRASVRPRTDVYETPEALVVVADVPGADPDSIELTLTEDVLTLRARSLLTEPEGWQPADAGLELPDYERSFRLQADIARDTLAASCKDGRLEVRLQKRLPRTSRIEVRSR
jgi:HSP20 family molecular chaperone IbpA